EVTGDLDSIAHARLEALDLGEPEAKFWVEDRIDEPTRQIAEYRFRFRDARRELVRARLQELIALISRLLTSLTEIVPADHAPVEVANWDQLVEAFEQVERLAGSQIPRVGRWSDLSRHLRFGQGCDVHDIAEKDWPSVRADIEAS